MAALPSGVAQEMIDAGIAFPVLATRTGLPLADIVVTGLSVMTTVVTLAQAPTALEDVARRLVAWRRHAALSDDPTISIDALGPNGRVSLRLVSTASEEELARAISLVLPRSDEIVRAQGMPSVPPETS